MGRLRWNQMLGEWVIITPDRADRPFQEKDHKCPFCVEQMPEWGDKGVITIENKYPSLNESVGMVPLDTDIVLEAPAYGACRVLLYTKDHNKQFEDLSAEQAELVLGEYLSVFEELENMRGIAYVFQFENRGRSIGTSLDHPHAQVYALPFVPPRIQREQIQLIRSQREEGECLICRMLKNELKSRMRIVRDSDNFVTLLPFAARLPYEVHIYPKTHASSLSELKEHLRELAMMIQDLVRRYKSVFDDVAYSMVFHTRPTIGSHDYWHFHIEFYPPWRDRSRLKYLASVENGAWTYTNESSPEEKARELRDAI